jgi:hypothetical protein
MFQLWAKASRTRLSQTQERRHDYKPARSFSIRFELKGSSYQPISIGGAKVAVATPATTLSEVRQPKIYFRYQQIRQVLKQNKIEVGHWPWWIMIPTLLWVNMRPIMFAHLLIFFFSTLHLFSLIVCCNTETVRPLPWPQQLHISPAIVLACNLANK